MATRTYNFITGIETSDAPSAATPSATGDILTLGFANTTYARRRDWGFPAANYAALTAIGTSGDNQRYDNQARLVVDTNEVWVFDADSVATPDGTTILQPDSGSGRWLIASAAGNGGGGGGANALDLLAMKLEQEATDGKQVKLDNSAGQSFWREPSYDYISGSLLESYTSGGSSMTVVWNPQVVRNADQNIDSTTSWTAVGAGASLTTSATAKTGSNSLQFDKNNTATNAGIRFDRGSQDFNVSAHWRCFFYINLPSLTGLSNVYLRMYDSGTTNYNEYRATTNYAGTALATGWNLIFFDLTQTASATGGTGWPNKNTLSRYIEIGVNTSSSAQTYTAILVDSLYFSFGEVRRLAVPGSEMSLFDSSNKNNIVFSGSNVSGDGVLTLANSISTSYTGGLGGSGAGRIKRNTVEFVQNVGAFDTDLSSGPIANSQEYRISGDMRESQSGSYQAFLDVIQSEIFEVKRISGTNVSGEDFGNVSANCVSGNTFDIFETAYRDGTAYYIHKGQAVLTGNSSYDSTNSFINLPFSSVSLITVGDTLAKKGVTGQISVSASGGDETFLAENRIATPNGVEIVDGGSVIPQAPSVYGYYTVGGVTSAAARKNQFGYGADLGVVGTGLNFQAEFQEGFYAASNFSNSNYLDFGTTTLHGDNEFIQLSFWFYPGVAFTGTLRTIFEGFTTNSDNAWHVYMNSSDDNIRFQRTNSGVTTVDQALGVLTVNRWHFIALGFQTNVAGYAYVNGNYFAMTSGAYGGAGGNVLVGRRSGTGSPLNALDRISNILVLRDGQTFSRAQLDVIYNNGEFRPYQFGKIVRHRHELTTGSGRRLSYKANLVKNTSVFASPRLVRMGVIKSS